MLREYCGLVIAMPPPNQQKALTSYYKSNNKYPINFRWIPWLVCVSHTLLVNYHQRYSNKTIFSQFNITLTGKAYANIGTT